MNGSQKTLIRNASAIITCDKEDRLLRDADILIEDGKIAAIGSQLSAEGAEIIDAKGCFVYPGLVNTHHHLLQAFSRNIPAIQKSELFDWLLYLYNVWCNVNPEYMYYSSMVAMGEFVKFGGTTMFDQHFAFPKHSSKEIIDREFDAAADIGLRFHAGRSCFTRGKSKGGLPPEELIETTEETLVDCERLIHKFHDPKPFAMRQVAIAPCSPFSVDTEVMVESAKLARKLGVRLHTHLAETLDEERYCLEVYGKRPLDWAEECGWLADDVWYAHAIHFTDEEIARMAKAGVGVAHNPVSNMKLASGVCKVPLMMKLGLPVGLAVDGCGSNDASNLLNEIRIAFLLHRQTFSADAPSGYEILKLATRGSADVLGRPELGELSVGSAADLFMIDVDLLDTVGGLMDPMAFLGTMGYTRPVELTMVAGKVICKRGRLLNVDEDALKEKAKAEVKKVYDKIET